MSLNFEKLLNTLIVYFVVVYHNYNYKIQSELSFILNYFLLK
jgi:hypothetical protein